MKTIHFLLIAVVCIFLTLTSAIQAQPPSILVHPESLTVATGDSIILRVEATGAQPIAYRWQFNNGDITGATDSIYRVSNVQPSHSGLYKVIVSNNIGTAISNSALVAVLEDCGQETALHLAQARDSKYRQRLEEREQEVYDYLYGGRQRLVLPLQQYCIPVVVHIIHDNGPENITDQQVYDAIQQLNEGFGNGVDTGINFRLATKNPDGNPSTGIVRAQSINTIAIFDGGGPYEQALKNVSRWPNDRYLNVWIVRCIRGGPPQEECPPPGTGGQTFGWAWYGVTPNIPTSMDQMDGIVVRHDHFGRSGTAAANNTRTLTHEAGHWLFLAHTFGISGQNPSCFAGVEYGNAPSNPSITPNCASTGDYCCDTPPQKKHWICSPPPNTCLLEVPDMDDPYENYLSYSHGCQNEFTANQRDRMHAWLNLYRTLIWSPENLEATGVTCADTCVLPPSGMVAWWPLDETSGPSAFDFAGIHQDNGTHTNSPTPTPGKVQGALCFNGTNQYVEVADHSEINFDTGDFSIDGWIRTTDNSGVKIILDKMVNTPTYRGYELYLYNGNLGLQLADGTYTNCNSAAFVANGAWRHFAVTVDRDNTAGIIFYLNGAPVGPTLNPTARSGSLTNTSALRMGCRSFSLSGFVNGSLDEIELFNRVLTPTEIQAIFNADSAGKCKCVSPPSGMVAWWPLDETGETQ